MVDLLQQLKLTKIDNISLLYILLQKVQQMDNDVSQVILALQYNE